MSDCRFGVSPVNYPDPDPDHTDKKNPHYCQIFFFIIKGNLSYNWFHNNKNRYLKRILCICYTL